MLRISELFDLNAVLFLDQGLERILQEGAIGQELGNGCVKLELLNLLCDRLACFMVVFIIKNRSVLDG